MAIYIKIQRWQSFASYSILNKVSALDSVAQWSVHQPANHRVASLIPSQGTGLGCGPGP